MKEDLITFETAKLAKEKGFNIPEEIFISNEENYITSFNIPTQSLLQKWLREEHSINVSVTHVIEDYYICEMTFLSGKYSSSMLLLSMSNDARRIYLYSLIDTHFKTYEQALEKGLQEALKLIRNK